MKIGVLIKQVPDTETKIRVKADKSGIEEGDIKYIVSPYDEYAIEEALKTKEKAGAGETTVISVGPDRAIETMRTALAMGVDKAIHICSDGTFLDSRSTATVLSRVLKEEAFDVVFCGKQAIDGDDGEVPQMIAEILDIPQVTIIEKFELSADKKGAQITRRIGGGAKEIYEINFPVIVSCDKGLNTPRYASLPGIMKAKSKPVDKKNISDLLKGISPGINFVNFQLPPERAAGKKIDGEPDLQASELVRLLREEAKAI